MSCRMTHAPLPSYPSYPAWRRRAAALALGAGLLLGAGGCGPGSPPGNDGPLDAGGDTELCDPAGDEDADCIANGLEGCTESPPADRDGDGRPNHRDVDADNDGIDDTVEVGPDCSSPRDTDGDALPDYLDDDSDNDGLRDVHEDRNGDGVIGTCTTPCSRTDGCGEDEHCSLPLGASTGVCVSLACLGGESNPLTPDTDGDGLPDKQEGTFICNPQSSDNPDGLKRIVYADSADTVYPTANWRIALEDSALHGVPVLQSPDSRDSAYLFDLNEAAIEVAGFLVSRPAAAASAVAEATAAVGALPAADSIQSVTPRVSGTPTQSLDGYDTVVSSILEVKTAEMTDVTAVRAAILPPLLARDAGEVSMPEVSWTGAMASEFIVVYQTVYRADADQTLYMGAVARRSAYDDRTRNTAIHANDLSNGTGHSQSANGEALECEPYLGDDRAVADIIWVVDESASMDDDRENIASVAADFFDRAVSAGLDFRMGVTDMNLDGPGGQPGIFASRQSGGTGDRWLLPHESAFFADNIREPSGPDTAEAAEEHGLTQARAALERHLPRSSDDPQKVREDARLVVLFVTDEKPDEVEEQTSMGRGNGEPTASQQAEIAELIASYVADFEDNDGVAHLIAEPLPYESTTCSSQGEHAFGYYELVSALGGQTGSVCQANLQPTIDAIIDAIVSEASPVKLPSYPISASIAVTRDDQVVPRSRESGWDYHGASNSIVFYNLPTDPDDPAEIVVSYRRWEEQVLIE